MRKVVCNSTPLIALHKIGKLDLLESMYGEIIIPKAVSDEVTIKENQKDNFIGSYAFIKVKEINNQEAKRFFNTSLHKGEVEVMILAKEIAADLCVIDDLDKKLYSMALKISEEE